MATLNPPAANVKRQAEWLILGLIGLSALVLVSAHLPISLRRLVLFPCAVGAASGALLGIAASFSGVRRTGRVTAVATTLAAIAVAASALVHWQLRATVLRRQNDADAARVLLARGLLESAEPPDDPEARRNYDSIIQQFRDADENALARRRQLLGFRSYLENRVTPLGRWTSPWPSLFWGAELAAAAAVAAIAFRRLAPAASVQETNPTAAAAAE